MPNTNDSDNFLPPHRRQEIYSWISLPDNYVTKLSHETTPTTSISIPSPSWTQISEDISDVSLSENYSSESLQFNVSLSSSQHHQSSTDISFPSSDDGTSVSPDETTDENPSTDASETLLLNLPDNVLFSFKMKPVSKLKQALNILCDPEFNAGWYALFHVNESGFKITVEGSGGDKGILSFSTTDLIDFQCHQPNFTGSRMVYLRTITQKLTAVKDDDATVLVYQLDGSTELSFMFGSNVLAKGFSVDIYSPRIEKQPPIEHFCLGVVHKPGIEQLIESLRNAEHPVVSVEIKRGQAMIQVTDYDKWRNECLEFKLANTFTIGRESGDFYRAWFKGSHATTLENACRMQPVSCVMFCKHPAKTVGFRFSLETGGCLVLLAKILEVYPRPPC